MPTEIQDVNTGLVLLAVLALSLLINVFRLGGRYIEKRWKPLNGEASDNKLEELRQEIAAMHGTLREQRCGYGPAEHARSERILEASESHLRIAQKWDTLQGQGKPICNLDPGDVRVLREMAAKRP